MSNLWIRIDQLCLETMDDFVAHLQSAFRLHYTTAVTGFSLGAAFVSALAGISMFRGSYEWMRLPASLFWAVLIALLIRWFARSYWRDRQRWNFDREMYWFAFAVGLKRRTRILRMVYCLLPLAMSLSAISDLAEGRFDLAARTIAGNIATFTPMLMLVCALCSPPRPRADGGRGR